MSPATRPSRSGMPDIRPQPSLAGTKRLLEAADLPVADLTPAHLAHFFYSGTSAAPIGVIGLELLGTEALLRSLVVAPEYRSAGLGAALVEHAECHARELGVRSLFLLTTTAAEFFGRCGYVAAERADAPPAVRATREFAALCPASSAFMVKTL